MEGVLYVLICIPVGLALLVGLCYLAAQYSCDESDVD